MKLAYNILANLTEFIIFAGGAAIMIAAACIML